MKYDSKLDHYQNSRARRQHWLNSPRTEYESLNDSEKAWLRELNELLRQYEDKFYPILIAKKHELKLRAGDASDWMQELNLGYVITFYLREDDPEYEEEDDNILMEIHEWVIQEGAVERGWGFGATEFDHAELAERFSGEKHCYLYHHLYGHCYLDWRDLLRIGSLYIDIKIEEQSGMLPVSKGFFSIKRENEW